MTLTVEASDVIQIAILYLVFYAILKSAKGSRFGQALMGFGIIAAALTAFGEPLETLQGEVTSSIKHQTDPEATNYIGAIKAPSTTTIEWKEYVE